MFASSAITCEFELARPTRIFYSGDQITGKITIVSTKKMHLEGICINLVGLERVQWSENSKALPTITHDDSTFDLSKDNKLCFKGSKEYMLASVQLSEAFELQAGEFIAQFSLALPDQLLPTCKQAHGYIDYNLQVVLQRKTKWQKIFRKRVILRNRLDLNKEAKYAKPEITSCSLKNNQLTLTIPYTGFVPGQLLPFSIKMSRLLYHGKLVLNLCQKTSYTSQTPTTNSKEVTKVLSYHITTHDEDGKLQLPLAIPISTMLENTLMKNSYYLETLILDEKLEVMKKFEVPIVVGTVALEASEHQKHNETHQQRAHIYDNLGTSKRELQLKERQHNTRLVSFDHVSCEPQKCVKIQDQKIVLPRAENLKKFCSKMYRKMAI